MSKKVALLVSGAHTFISATYEHALKNCDELSVKKRERQSPAFLAKEETVLARAVLPTFFRSFVRTKEHYRKHLTNLASYSKIPILMLNYDELSDQEKAVDYPEEFIEELRNEYLSGNEDTALNRAEEQGIDLQVIIS